MIAVLVVRHVGSARTVCATGGVARRDGIAVALEPSGKAAESCGQRRPRHRCGCSSWILMGKTQQRIGTSDAGQATATGSIAAGKYAANAGLGEEVPSRGGGRASLRAAGLLWPCTSARLTSAIGSRRAGLTYRSAVQEANGRVTGRARLSWQKSRWQNASVGGSLGEERSSSSDRPMAEQLRLRMRLH